MSKNNFTLDSLEKQFKNVYKTYPELFSHPMTYSEYEKLDEQIRKLYSIMEQHHRQTGKSNENTVYNVFSAPDDYVKLVRHARYSFPLLHNHEYVELVYVYRGECTHFIEDQQFLMKNGDLCILAPNTMHAISAVRDDAIILNLMVSQKLFDESFMNLMHRVPSLAQFFESILYNRASTPYILYPTGEDRWMHEMILYALTERKETDYLYKEGISLFVRQLFVHILQDYELSAIVADPERHTQDDKIVSLLGYITVNASHVTLDMTADFFGYNKAYLSQMLRKYTGKTFTTFLNETRMKKAATLLAETSLSITEISLEVGCYDASHFNRKFTKIYQMSPKDYRKKYQI